MTAVAMRRTPRDYQVKVYEEARAVYREGARGIVIVIPTGGGKTLTAMQFIAGAIRKGGGDAGSVLWLAHRSELIQQAYTTIVEEGVDEMSVGIIKAGQRSFYRPLAPVQVASVQTLLAWMKSGRQLPNPRVVVFDEAHHMMAERWRLLAESFSRAMTIGLTATPQRSDGKPLGRSEENPQGLFDAMVVGPTARELVDRGVLVPCEVFSPLRAQNGDIAEEPIDALVRCNPDSRRVLVFGKSVPHAEQIALDLVDAGYRAAMIEGKMHSRIRADHIAAFAGGSLDALTNCAILGEGFDVPSADTVVLGRAFDSVVAYLQAVGRGMRCAEGKTRCVVVDLSGASRKHGHPIRERVFKLHGPKGIENADEQDDDGTKVCFGCRVRVPSDTKTCPCGYVFSREVNLLPGVTGDPLHELGEHDVVSDAEKLARYEFLCRVAEDRGYKTGWIYHSFRASYGHSPPRAWRRHGAA